MEDIPMLVRHFTRKFAARMNKRIEFIPEEVMDALAHHSWTGNVRELENFVERAVILSRGSTLDPPIDELVSPRHEAATEPVTLRDAERAHILRVLRDVDGVMASAAVRLAVPRTTLFYKMRRLGIGQPRPQKARSAAV
jgi:formate hydrogenlyase transcriptional activator